jgi:hypothetical protein
MVSGYGGSNICFLAVSRIPRLKICFLAVSADPRLSAAPCLVPMSQHQGHGTPAKGKAGDLIPGNWTPRLRVFASGGPPILHQSTRTAAVKLPVVVTNGGNVDRSNVGLVLE